MRSAKQLTFDDHRMRSGRGGPRRGAGRPRKLHGVVHHVRRDPLPTGCPAHVTLRVRRGIPSLRKRAMLREFRGSLRRACERGEFRVVHYSIQRNHVHLIVEAAGRQALGRGMKAVGIRLARAVNRVVGRTGPVLLGRYHVRALKSPREVRNALAYVLLNARKHWRERTGAAPPIRLDEASSGAWFDGWSREPPGARPLGAPEVARPRTWVLRIGWRHHRLIAPAEVPGGRGRDIATSRR